jgi:hypothetical protein
MSFVPQNYVIICVLYYSYFHFNHEIPSQHGILKLKDTKSATNQTSETLYTI